jgi:hypothetical protein
MITLNARVSGIAGVMNAPRVVPSRESRLLARFLTSLMRALAAIHC